jgi:uncharacterized protein YdeI (YjbR/CyaY-like superfamily)/tRNA(Arg) A34 adenosine deaminase TadA
MEVPENSVHPKSRAEWRRWLRKHHTRDTGLWLITYKKASGKPRMDYEDAMEEALCFGWIDSKVGKLNDERSMLWVAPRKPKTGWSKPNKQRVERLIAGGLMAPAGLAKINAAKKDGSWSALDGVEALEIPPDLRKALAAYKHAAQYFEALPRTLRKFVSPKWAVGAHAVEDHELSSAPPPRRAPMLTRRRCLTLLSLLLPTLAYATPVLQQAMARARALRDAAVRAGDQPYGAVVLRGSEIVGEGPSRVVTANDVTAHAEREAIRDAIKRLGKDDLSGCVLVSTSRPCRLCETAAAKARIARMVHGDQLTDAGPPT